MTSITAHLSLHDEILAELASDPRVDASNLAVNVDSGIVTLVGTVPSLYQKWGAEEAVKRVRGVRAIVAEITVDVPAIHVRSDADIARAITDVLFWDTALPSSLQCVVDNGQVTLYGHAKWDYQREEAEQLVRRIAGVRAVRNDIEVQPAVAASDVRHHILTRLHRNAQIDGSRIHVMTVGGHVTLSGFARTWHERSEAARAAWTVPGVTAVDNDIDVE